MLASLLERRGTAFENLWSAGALTARPSPTGRQVTQDTSLKLSAVYGSVRLIADTVSTLPIDHFIRMDGNRRPFRPKDAWVDRPSTRLSRVAFWQQVMVSLLLDGNAFVHVIRNGQGQVIDLEVLDPQQCKVEKWGVVYTASVNIRWHDLVHVTEMVLPGQLRGVSRIAQAEEQLGLAGALEEYAARFFGNGASAGGVLEFPGELTRDQAKEAVEAWEQSHRGLTRSHRPAVLYGGAKFTPTSVDPTDSQLLDERRFAVEEAARIFRVPPFMLGVTEGGMSFASLEQQQLFFAQHTILPYVELLEDSFHKLLEQPRSFIKFNVSSLVRADLATRTQSYSTALLAGYMSVNDVRRLEDMQAVEDGDQYRVPLQNVPVTDAQVVTKDQKSLVVSRLVSAGYTPESAAELVGLDGLEHTGLASVQLQRESD